MEGVDSRRTPVFDFSFRGSSLVECTRDCKNTPTAAMVVNSQAIQGKIVA